jgi:ADP-ribosylglycohydrolase
MDGGILDRARGVMLGTAAGDALGAGYEFGDPFGDDVPVVMKGGGNFDWAPGQWTDDTSMAVPILEAAEQAVVAGDALVDHLDHVASRWYDWSRKATDVGVQTRSILSAAGRAGGVTADSLLAESRAFFARHGQAAGNGSLMRTAPVALACLHDVDALVEAARRISDLTHAEPDAGDACVLWCLAIRHAVLEGELDLRSGLEFLPVESRDRWAARVDEAEARTPRDFPKNGWVVHAFQEAWSAIVRTPSPDGSSGGNLVPALEAIVRAGRDTDTVAAIAGGLLGARWGAAAVPSDWVDLLHGWPGLTGEQLADRGLSLVPT